MKSNTAQLPCVAARQRTSLGHDFVIDKSVWQLTKELSVTFPSAEANPLSKALYTNVAVTLQRIVRRHLTLAVARSERKISAELHRFSCNRYRAPLQGKKDLGRSVNGY